MERVRLDCRGSTLVILLLILSVIFLMGITALSLAVTNYKMKKLNSELKKTFYLAEAGTEEAYIITSDFVIEAIDYAISKVEESEETKRESDENALSEEEVDIIFRGAFKSFIKGNCIDVSPNTSLISILKDNKSYTIYRDGYPKIDPKITELEEGFLLEVKSTYVKGNINKAIIIKCSIDIPNYNYCILNDDFKLGDITRIIEWSIER